MVEKANTAIDLSRSQFFCELVKKVQPSSEEELAILYALYRPDAITYGLLDDYLRQRAGSRQTDTPNMLLGTLLSDTYGVLIFCEQLDTVFIGLGSFSEDEARDIPAQIRTRSVSKARERFRAKFRLGCAQNDIHESAADEIFERLIRDGAHTFPKHRALALARETFHKFEELLK